MGCDGSKDEFVEEEEEEDEELSEPKARRRRRPERVATGHQRRRKSHAPSVMPSDELIYTTRPPTIVAYDETNPSSGIDVRKMSSVKVQKQREKSPIDYDYRRYRATKTPLGHASSRTHPASQTVVIEPTSTHHDQMTTRTEKPNKRQLSPALKRPRSSRSPDEDVMRRKPDRPSKADLAPEYSFAPAPKIRFNYVAGMTEQNWTTNEQPGTITVQKRASNNALAGSRRWYDHDH